ncbi:MAG TPA: glutamate racemase [Oculatellaceae cyanobacterium]
MDMWSEIEANQVLKGSSKIGLFDSGVGGLSVLRELQSYASSSGRNIEFVYVGDTARCPYGNRSTEEIRLFVEEIVLWLNERKVDSIIMACNTSAALALPFAKQISNVPVIDLIGPTASTVLNHATKIGVMATAATVRSRAFSRAFTALNDKAEIVELGCPDLVPIIEAGNIDRPETILVVRKYVDALKEAKVNAIILGCTHFPFLRKLIQQLVGDDIYIIDPAESITTESKGVLKRFLAETTTDLSLNQDLSLNTDFYVTGSLAQFNKAASKCLGQTINATNNLSLGELAGTHARRFLTQAANALNNSTNLAGSTLPQAAAS